MTPLAILEDRLATLGGAELVSAWITAMRPYGEPMTTLLDQIEEETGMRPSLSRLGEWANGKRKVPAIYQRVFRRDLCRYLLADDLLGDQLATMLEPIETA